MNLLQSVFLVFSIIDPVLCFSNVIGVKYSSHREVNILPAGQDFIHSIHYRRKHRSIKHTNLNVSTVADQTKEEEGVTIGDTKGAALIFDNVAISRGSNRILSDINFRIERNQRWGLVGPNGCGKSTLLGCLTGSVRKDEGQALIAPKLRLGYLRQTAVSGSTKTVFDEAASEMNEINEAKHRLTALGNAVSEGDTSQKLLDDLDTANSDFTAAGGWTQEQDVDTVLKGLGFQPEDSERLCSDFSGGWQMRIGLARLLLSKPNVLLLDEPSNHLDSSARDWLGNYLANFEGSLVLISHDIALLQAAVDSIAEISGDTLLTYVSCSYSKYLEEKEFRAKSAMAEYERNMAEAARLQAYVDKWGASATKATSAQSRVKMIEKMKKEGKLTPPPTAIVEKRWKPSLSLPSPPKSIGEVLLGLENADIGYPGSPALLKKLSFELKRGTKLILRGPNGAGKSTLVTALRGALPLLKGDRYENEKLRLGSFTQDLAQQLDGNSRAIDLVTAYAREGKFGDINVSNEDARNAMGRLGLSGDKALRKISELSGGEKARVALSMFCLKACNVYVLDEPSNHLDVECIEALSDALSSWGGKDGAIIVVSHDKSFCDSVGFNTVGTVKDGSLVIEERDLNESDWKQYDMELFKASETGVSTDQSTAEKKELTPEEKADLKKKRKMAYNAPKQIEKLEKKISASEEKIAQIDDKMMNVGNDVGKLVDLSNEKKAEEDEIAIMMSEWEELELLLAEVS
mmetsp:Transcript_9215/g.11619  ORF Transcript_9215/g.11619 Transcript_9215/m.11619 type:complete len:745 (+) Transcript_9215:27-2261(+)